MLKIGITGGIGSGKTTVCRIFEQIGIPVYYADPRAKWLMNHSKPLKTTIKNILGKEAYHRNGRLNRTFVAKQIFGNRKLLQQINQEVHPAVNADANTWMSNQADGLYILYEAALLIENGSYKNFDKIIVVTAPENLRIKRVMSRDKMNKKEVLKRIKNQLPQEQKDKLADFLIVNDGTKLLLPQIQKVHMALIELKSN